VAFKIEKALTTLFGFYKLQSQGNLPIAVAESVQPSIDLNTHALAASGMRSRNFTQGTPSLGVIGTYTQEEDWYVVGANAQFVAGAAGEICLLSVDLLTPGGSNNSYYTIATMSRDTTSGSNTALAAGEVQATRYIQAFGGPFYTRAGSKWQLACSYVTGGITGTSFGQILYYEISS
jgi:hypothetical protein